ncbi:MAG: class II aldolase/adducin family protein [Acidobacteriota bacterium]
MSLKPQVAAEIIAAGRRLYERHVIASYEGNLSARLDDARILATSSGVHKGRLRAADLVVTDMEGRPLGEGRPSSEIRMHLEIYRRRPDLGAIVHAHPTVATGWAVAGRTLPTAALAEIVTMLGCVPVAPYGTPSTEELAETVAGPIESFDVLLLANHGAVAAGADVEQAEERMYQLEHFAQIALVSELLGGARRLSREEMERLSALRQSSGDTPVPPVCYPSPGESGTITLTRDELVRLIADAVRTLR